MRVQSSIGGIPCRASLPRVDLLVYWRAGILIYLKESASRRFRSRRCMQKRWPRCMRRHRGTNKARYRRQMSKAKLDFIRSRARAYYCMCVRVCMYADRQRAASHVRNFT